LKDFAPAMMGAPLIEDLGVVGEAIGNLGQRAVAGCVSSRASVCVVVANICG
jgi:hypothetical protein